MRQLAIFAKYWEPGQVKTRLAPAIGARAASRLYRACLTALLRRFAASAEQLRLIYAPADRHVEFANLAGAAWQLRAQGEGDLGQRMARHLAAALQAGAKRVVLIGSDSPDLPSEYIAQAFDALKRSPVVLGPTADGGYYLVGVSGTVPPIFSGIAWSSPAVWSQTLRGLEQAGCPYTVLPEWYDVDEAADLVRLRDELAAQGPLEQPLQELLTAVRNALGTAEI